MEIYNSEQDQVDALKAWWDKNGRMAIVAIVAVLLGVLGWKSWMGQQRQQAESAAVIYQQMNDAIASNPEAALEAGRTIIGDYPGTIYATMASMAMARVAVDQGDLDAAAAHLRAAADKADQPELGQLARLRLGKVLLAQGKADEALNTVQGADAGAMQGGYDELRGDILLAQGDAAAARDAYTNALSTYGELPDKRELVQMKIDNLAESAKK